MKINTSRKAGFTLVEIMIVVAIIGLLAAIAIPNFIKARNTSQTNACINNLRQIDSAIQQWALETKKSDSAAPTSVVYTYLKSQLVPVCPGGGAYSLPAQITGSPSCSKSASGHAIPTT